MKKNEKNEENEENELKGNNGEIKLIYISRFPGFQIARFLDFQIERALSSYLLSCSREQLSRYLR